MDFLNYIRGPLEVLQPLGIIVLGVMLWLRKPGEDASVAVAALREGVGKDIEELRATVHREVAKLNNGHVQLEERILHLPTRNEVSELAGDMKAVKAQMLGLVGTQAVQTMSLNRIESWLINGRGSR